MVLINPIIVIKKYDFIHMKGISGNMNNNKKPLVSVIVPCYNHEKYIEDCIYGLLAQTYENIEVILFDDNSTDRTFEIIQSYRKQLESRFERVVIEKNEKNFGTSKTMNKMIQIAKGTFIETTASDDWLFENAVQDFVNFFEKNTDCVLAYANMECCDSNSHYYKKNCLEKAFIYEKQPPSGSGLVKKLVEGNFVSGASSFFPMKTVMELGVFDENVYSEDWEFAIRAAISGNILYMDRVIGMYRISDMSRSRCGHTQSGIEKNRIIYKDAINIIFRYINYFDERDLSLFYTKQLKRACGLNDRELCRMIIKEMKRKKYTIALSRLEKVYLFCVMSPFGKIIK